MRAIEYTCGHNSSFARKALAPPRCLACGQGEIVFAPDMWAIYTCGHHVDPLSAHVSHTACLNRGCSGRLQGFTLQPPESLTLKTIDGGEHTTTPAATGRKFDGEKPAMDLMPPLMELEVSKVLTFGAQKYDAENWRNVPDLHSRYRSAAKRHINALKRGEQYDEESGRHHAAHAVCCLMFMGEIDLETAASAT